MGAAFRHAARVKVTTRDGRTFEKLLPDRRGSPENPLTPEEIEDKFRHVVAPCVSASAQSASSSWWSGSIGWTRLASCSAAAAPQ